MSVLRILYLSPHAIDADDGPALHIAATTRELAALGADVTLVAPSGTNTTIEGVEVIPIPKCSGRRIRRILAARTKEIGASFDILYTRGSLLRASNQAKAHGLKVVVEYNGVLLDELKGGNPLRKMLYRRDEEEVAGLADHAIAVDASIATRMAELHPETNIQKKVTVVENGCEAQRFAQSLQTRKASDYSAPPSKLVFVGALQPWTQLTRAIAALGELGARYSLSVIGDGPEKSRFEALAREAGVEVLFKGRLSHPELVQELPSYDIGINPDAGRSSSPLKVPEYLAAGLAVVSCGPPSLAYLREEGFGEWLEGTPEAKSFALAIERISDTQRYTLEERKWRSDWACQHRSWRASAARLLEALRSL